MKHKNWRNHEKTGNSISHVGEWEMGPKVGVSHQKQERNRFSMQHGS